MQEVHAQKVTTSNARIMASPGEEDLFNEGLLSYGDAPDAPEGLLQQPLKGSGSGAAFYSPPGYPQYYSQSRPTVGNAVAQAGAWVRGNPRKVAAAVVVILLLIIIPAATLGGKQQHHHPVAPLPRSPAPPPSVTCANFSVSNTVGATVNTANCSLVLSPGDPLTYSLCGVSEGDTIVRLIAPDGTTELARDDDGCGGPASGSYLTTHLPCNAQPGAYVVMQGCYSRNQCSGSAYTQVVHHGCAPRPPPPPVGPPPALPNACLLNASLGAPANCTLSLQPGQSYNISTNCVDVQGDTTLALYDAYGFRVAYNDDDHSACPGKAFASRIGNFTAEPCTTAAVTYTLSLGCFRGVCNSTVDVSYSGKPWQPCTSSSDTGYVPGGWPTSSPPPRSPPPLAPALSSPPPPPDVTCRPFILNETQRAPVNCTIEMGPGDELIYSLCGSSRGNTYVRLIAPNGTEIAHDIAHDDDGCSVSGQGSYLHPGQLPCDARPGPYTIVQGCYGRAACSGTAYTVLRHHSCAPKPPPPPRGAPPPLNPSCPPFFARNGSTVKCSLTLLPGQTYNFSTSCADVQGDTALALYDAWGTRVAYNDDDRSACLGNPYASRIGYYTVPACTRFFTYDLVQGCFGTRTCNATVLVSYAGVPWMPCTTSSDTGYDYISPRIED